MHATGNLDSKTGLEIIKLLGKLSLEEGRTIILVTHDKKMASLSHQMLFLKDGKLLKGEKKGTLETDACMTFPPTSPCVHIAGQN